MPRHSRRPREAFRFPGSTRAGWGNGTSRMDARTNMTNIKRRLPSRHLTEQTVAASDGPTGAAVHLPTMDLANEEIFKKTPCVADSKPGGRYVAKDMYEVGGIPLLMKTMLDSGRLHGDCITVTGRTIAENLKSVKPNTVTGGVVGPKGNLAPEG